MAAATQSSEPTTSNVSAANPDPTPVVNSQRVWTTLITNLDYLPGLLTLSHSLRASHTAYPLLALYTSTFPASGLRALHARGIPTKEIPYLLPSAPKDFANDPRFYDCWSKLTPFGLVEYERVVQLDSDMLVLRNMDELMELELDGPELGGTGTRVFAACHACVCNPLSKPHYPADWIPANCAHTTLHATPTTACETAPPPTAGLGMPNGGLQVVNPSRQTYERITTSLSSPASTASYEFADQSLLSDLFPGRWVALPYVYNALKTMRRQGVHDVIWRDDEVRNVHYILSPKPWDEVDKDDASKATGASEEEAHPGSQLAPASAQPPAESGDGTHRWWWAMNRDRKRVEREQGIEDDF
ncbi:MAG: hypothetical protein M1819_005827 [Sarea resinae]|nr:MAG: hypothetical protein M1819_005827 [Sarea resinae]